MAVLCDEEVDYLDVILRNREHVTALPEILALLVKHFPSAYQSRRARCATSALPGTEEKVQILCRRFERGEDLFHRSDFGTRTDLGLSLAALCGQRCKNGHDTLEARVKTLEDRSA